MPSDQNSYPPQESASGDVPGRSGDAVDALKKSAGGGDFLRLLVHEMRNFVAPVRNAVYLLRIGGVGEAQIRAAAEIIERQATGMQKLLDNLADAERARRGDIALERAPLDLAEILDKAIASVKQLVNSRRQRLHISLPPGALRLQGDSARLVQAFSLVLARAVHHTPEQGEIWLDAIAADDGIDVRVRDTGADIPAESLSILFEFFAAANPSTQSGSRNLGIDLPLAHKLIELHNGRLTAASAGAGKGSELVIHLPAQDSANESMPAESVQRGAAEVKAAAGGDTSHGGSVASTGVSGKTESTARGRSTGRRVLIVDDNAALRETFSDLIQDMGHEVFVAAEGLQALEMARQYVPEFVFLDINMPNLNGYEVARQLRAQFPARAMQLAMMSGETLTEPMIQRAKQAGFDHCIDKIGDLEVLRQLLGEKK